MKSVSDLETLAKTNRGYYLLEGTVHIYMPRRPVRELSVDELREKWASDLRHIAEHTNYMAIHRIRYRMVERWLMGPPPRSRRLINRNLQAWGWIESLWKPVGLMHIRREMDGQPRTICLMTLLRELEARPDAVTNISTVEVVADRAALQEVCSGSLSYAHQQIAHRTATDEPEIAALDASMDAVFACVDKYHLLILGVPREPTEDATDSQWLNAFKHPWFRDVVKSHDER